MLPGGRFGKDPISINSWYLIPEMKIPEISPGASIIQGAVPMYVVRSFAACVAMGAPPCQEGMDLVISILGSQ